MNRGVPVPAAGERSVTRVGGQLAAVRSRRVGASAALEAELQDGRDLIRLVWMGQRRIIGIEPGAALTVEGRLTVHRGRTTMFNPRYQLGAGPSPDAGRSPDAGLSPDAGTSRDSRPSRG
jgi:hypothetical protein